MSPLTYGLALFASVCAVAMTRTLLGQSASFMLSDPKPVPLRALIIVVVLGVISALVGVAFNRLRLGLIRSRTHRLSRMVAGGLVGGVASVCVVKAASISGGGHTLAESIFEGRLCRAYGVDHAPAYTNRQTHADERKFCHGSARRHFCPNFWRWAL